MLKVYLFFLIFRLPLAFVLDWLLGDPAWLPHPVVFLGRMISRLEALFRGVFPATKGGERFAGALLAAVVCSYAFCLPLLVLYLLVFFALRLHLPWLFYAALLLDLFWGSQCLAARCLKNEAEGVLSGLSRSLEDARSAVGRIVGRDSGRLDRQGVIRACVETVAESTTDGVVSPMIFYGAGGSPLALLYKAINTMDSMVGYKNDRYRYFGTAAARLDDLANLAGARLSALCMILASFFLRFLSCFNRYAFPYRPLAAARVFLRDRYRHDSPNSAQTEAVMAGALGIRLGGGAFYGGVFEKKPWLGDDLRAPAPGDIDRAASLMYTASFFALLLCSAVKLGVLVFAFGLAL